MRIPNKFNGYSADGIRLYNDPVTLAMVGAAAGAAMKPNDPLKGAMLGATVGFTGGTALGVGGAAAGGTGLASAGTALGGGGAANAAALGAETTGLGAGVSSALPGTMGVGQGLALTPTTIGSASNVSSIANAANATEAVNAASTAPEWFGLDSMNMTSKGLTAPAGSGYNLANTAASPMEPSFMDKLGMAGKSAYENPMMTGQALQATQGLLAPEQQPQMSPAPTVPIQARGQIKPYDPMAYMNPYQQSVIGGQPISLLG